MPIFCSHCNEELFGAVNRCWKCGRHFSARPAAGDTPPIRRAPAAGPIMLVREERGVVILDDVGRPVVRDAMPAAEPLIITDAPAIEAEIVDVPPPVAPEPEPLLVATLAEPAVIPSAVAPVEKPRPAGSPFAAGWIDDDTPFAPTEPLEPENDQWTSLAASGSLGLGGVALLASFFGWWPLALGLAGVAAGTWGLGSRQRTIATAGLGLSCLAIALAEFQAAAAIYVHYNGVHPFAY